MSYTAMTDGELLSLLKEDDAAAFNALFTRYWDRLHRTVLSKTGDSQAAFDIVQDVFVQVWQQRVTLEIEIRETLSQYTMSLTDSWGQSFSNSAYKFSAGAEYSYMNEFFLRAGYVTETTQAGGLDYFTAGVGAKYSAMGFDFSYLASSGNGITRNPLSNTFRLGIVFRWK